MLSVRFEVGVYLLLAPAGADKRGPKAPFPLVEKCRNTVGDSQESTRCGVSRVLMKALGFTDSQLVNSHDGSIAFR